MKFEELHKDAKWKLEEWAKTLIAAPGVKTAGRTLFTNYTIWLLRQRIGKPIHRAIWAQWMNEHFEKTRHMAMVAYADVKPGYDPYAESSGDAD